MENVRYETEFGIVHAPTSKDAKVDWEKLEDIEYFNKRIGIKILKQRAQPRPKFDAHDLKKSAMIELASSTSAKEFRESNLKSLNSSQGTIQRTRTLQVASIERPT